MPAYDLGSVQGRIDIKYDPSGVRKAKSDVDEYKEKLTSIDTKLSELGGNNSGIQRTSAALSALAGNFAKLSAVAAGAGIVVGQVVTTAGQLSGALGVLPGVAAAGGTAMATLAIGTMGFSDALKEIGDPKKFAEAIKDLAPAAQDAARSIKGLKPAFDSIQIDTQQALFQGLGERIQTIGTVYTPIARKGLTGMATELNRAAKAVAEFLKNANTQADIGTIFDNGTRAVGNLREAVGPLLEALRDITVVSSDVFADLTTGAGEAAQKFADFIAEARKTGDLRTWIEQGITSLQQLWTVAKNLAAIFKEVFEPFTGAGSGGSALAWMAQATTQLRQLVESARGQRVLQEFANTVKEVGAALAGKFMAIMRQVGPILHALMPLFAEFAMLLGATFVAALRAIAPPLKVLAQFLSANKDWIAPLLVSYVVLAKSIKIASAAMRGFNVVAGNLRTGKRAIQTLITQMGLIPTRVGLAALAVQNFGKRVGLAMATAGRTVGAAGATIGRRMALIGAAAGRMAAATGAAIGRFIASMTRAATATIAQAARMTASMIKTTALFVAKWIRMAAVAMARAAMIAAAWLIANPFVAIAAAVVALVALIIMNWDKIVAFLRMVWNKIKAIAVTVWNAIKSFFVSLWNSIWSFIQSVWNRIYSTIVSFLQRIRSGIISRFNTIRSFITNIWNVVWGFIKGVWNSIYNTIRNFVMRIWNSIRSRFNALRSFITNIWNVVWGFIKSVWNNITSTISNAVSNVISAVRNGFNRVVSFVRSIPGRIMSALGNLGSLLVSAGRDLLMGLWEGIKGAFGWVMDKIKGIANSIADGFKSMLGISSPSKVFMVFGGDIMAGLSEGIGNSERDVMGKLKSSVDNVKRTAEGEADSAQSPMYRVGRTLMEAMQRGIQDGIAHILSLVKSFQDNVNNAVNQTMSPLGRAAQNILNAMKSGQRFYEDFSFEGAGNLNRRYNDQLAQAFYGGGGEFTRGQMSAFLRKTVAAETQSTTQYTQGSAQPLIGSLTMPLEQGTNTDQLVHRLLYEVQRVGKGVYQR